MSTFQRQYKAKTVGFGDPVAARVVRAKKHERARKSCRSKTFTENRNVPNTSSHSSGSASNKEIEEPSVPEDRMTRLLKWKENRKIQKKIEKQKTKQPFVVRAVDKDIFSLPTSSKVEEKSRTQMSLPLKKITKVTEKRLMRRGQLQGVVKPSAKSPHSAPEKECIVSDKQNSKSPKGLNQKPLFGRVHLSFNELFKRDINSSNVETHNDNSFKSEQVDICNEPIFFSPYVVSSRGKSNARDEQRMKRGFSLNRSLSNDIPTKDTVMRNLNISIEEEERTAQYFQFLLSKEIDRLNELCYKWAAIKEEPDTTEDGRYQINQAIGQTYLLISKKFERFRSLVSDCENGKGEMLVTCKDLQGFWDMMYMEVKNCDSRFDKLEQLRSRGWIEEDVHDASKLPAKKKAAVKKKVVPRKASSIITFMRERRKNMMEGAENNNDIELKILDKKSKTRRSIGASDNKPSPIKHSKDNKPSPIKHDKDNKPSPIKHNKDNKLSPIKHNKKRSSILQKVQLSATKKLRSPLTVMKISQMCKTPEVKLDSTISYINSDQTPGKSILKQPKKLNKTGSCTKSSHKVNFNDTVILNEVPIDEETQTKMELAAALARIDNLEFNNSIEDIPVHAEKRLTFDDSSLEECEVSFDTNVHSEKTKSIDETINMTPIDVQGVTSLESPTLCDNSISPLPRRSLRRQTALDASDSMLDIVFSTPFNGIVNGVDLNTTQTLDDEKETHEHSESIRILRNRSITSSNIPTPRRRARKMSTNKQESEYKENIHSKDDLNNDISTTSLIEKSKTKKSRRSIKFSEEVCNTYRDKTAFPMTPHVRRHNTQSSEKKRKTNIADSTSTDSPAPERIRRSLNRK